MTEKEIRDLFAQHEVDLGKTDVWSVQQALVIKHAALERLGAKLGVRWAEPRFLRSERDEAVVLAIGYLTNSEGIDTAREWSVGEAVINVNYRVSGKQAAYVYAMAEKRAKDRVILKLANLHGAYSEDEADDFKQSAPRAGAEQAGGEASNRAASPSADPKPDAFGLPPLPEGEPTESQKLIYAALRGGIGKAGNLVELELFKVEQIKQQLPSLTSNQQTSIEDYYKERYRALRPRAVS